MTQTSPSTTVSDAESAILSAIKANAVAADRSPQSNAALQCAQAVHELAKAYDLLRNNT